MLDKEENTLLSTVSKKGKKGRVLRKSLASPLRPPSAPLVMIRPLIPSRSANEVDSSPPLNGFGECFRVLCMQGKGDSSVAFANNGLILRGTLSWTCFNVLMFLQFSGT